MCSLTLFSLYSNDLLKYKNRVIKTCLERSFELKNVICKEKSHLQRKVWNCYKSKISYEN